MATGFIDRRFDKVLLVASRYNLEILSGGYDMEMEREGLLDLAGASQVMGLSRSRLYALAVSGEIPTYQLNGKGKILLRRNDVEALLRPRAKTFVQQAAERGEQVGK